MYEAPSFVKLCGMILKLSLDIKEMQREENFSNEVIIRISYTIFVYRMYTKVWKDMR